jgi:hypothetical protein
MPTSEKATIAGIALSVIVALGTIAVPSSFWDAHEGLRVAVLAGCAISAICCVIYILGLYISPSTKKLLAFILIIGGISAVGAGAILWGSAASQSPATAGKRSEEKPWKHELADLYAADFNKFGSLQREWNAKTPDGSAIIMKFKISPDFESGVDLVSIYIPVSNTVTIDNNIYGIIHDIAGHVREQYDSLKGSVGVGMSAPGMPYSEIKELKFSGRVFVYTMQPFTPIQIGDLMKHYQDKGISLQIRGHDYWYANKDR